MTVPFHGTVFVHCSDYRIKDRWSDPKYLQYVLLMLNSSHNSEINDIPLRLHYGDFDSLQAKYKDNLFTDITTRNAYIKDLYNLQKIANEISANYQLNLHKTRISKSTPSSRNKYQPGDYVLKLRNLPLNFNMLQHFKYAGPFIVISHDENAVTV